MSLDEDDDDDDHPNRHWGESQLKDGEFWGTTIGEGGNGWDDVEVTVLGASEREPPRVASHAAFEMVNEKRTILQFLRRQFSQ